MELAALLPDDLDPDLFRDRVTRLRNTQQVVTRFAISMPTGGYATYPAWLFAGGMILHPQWTEAEIQALSGSTTYNRVEVEIDDDFLVLLLDYPNSL